MDFNSKGKGVNRLHQFHLHGFFKTMLLILKSKISKFSRPKLKLH